MDLSLVPIDDLLDEVERRSVSFICAYELPKEKDSLLEFRYGTGSWYRSIQLASILNNDVLNNWNGELKFLQKILDEEQNSNGNGD